MLTDTVGYRVRAERNGLLAVELIDEYRRVAGRRSRTPVRDLEDLASTSRRVQRQLSGKQAEFVNDRKWPICAGRDCRRSTQRRS